METFSDLDALLSDTREFRTEVYTETGTRSERTVEFTVESGRDFLDKGLLPKLVDAYRSVFGATWGEFGIRVNFESLPEDQKVRKAILIDFRLWLGELPKVDRFPNLTGKKVDNSQAQEFACTILESGRYWKDLTTGPLAEYFGYYLLYHGLEVKYSLLSKDEAFARYLREGNRFDGYNYVTLQKDPRYRKWKKSQTGKDDSLLVYLSKGRTLIIAPELEVLEGDESFMKWVKDRGFRLYYPPELVEHKFKEYLSSSPISYLFDKEKDIIVGFAFGQVGTFSEVWQDIRPHFAGQEDVGELTVSVRRNVQSFIGSEGSQVDSMTIFNFAELGIRRAYSRGMRPILLLTRGIFQSLKERVDYFICWTDMSDVGEKPTLGSFATSLLFKIVGGKRDKLAIFVDRVDKLFYITSLSPALIKGLSLILLTRILADGSSTVHKEQAKKILGRV